MSYSEIKQKSLSNIKDHWTKIIILTFIYLVVSLVPLYIPIVGFIFWFIFSTPITYGYILTLIKTINNEDISVIDFFVLSFKNTGRAWRVIGNLFVRLFIPILILFGCAVLVVYNTLPILEALTNHTLTLNIEISPFMTLGFLGYIATFIFIVFKFLKYSLRYYLMMDYPNENGYFIVNKSVSLMNGNVIKLIGFFLSFIGWFILSLLTFGIVFIFLIPYVNISFYYFYKNLSPETT